MNIVPCDTCPATCCRKPNVDITIFDAYEIGRTLKMSLADFTELLWLEQPDTHRRICLADNDRHYRFRLKRVKAVEEGLRCVFLLRIHAERSMCSIYNIRPEICRSYPTYLEGGGVVATSGGKYCPDNAWSIEKMDVHRLRADWVRRLRLNVLHDFFVDGWNERVFSPGTKKMTEGDFHGYVTSAVSELEAICPEVLDRPERGSPFQDAFSEDRLKEITDRILRRIGWRTDDTVIHARPTLGRKGKLPMAPIPPGGDDDADDDEAILHDPEPAAAAAAADGAVDWPGV